MADKVRTSDAKKGKWSPEEVIDMEVSERQFSCTPTD